LLNLVGHGKNFDGTRRQAMNGGVSRSSGWKTAFVNWQLNRMPDMVESPQAQPL
jgi:hypothetical protein